VNCDQPRNNATGDLLAVFHDILNQWKNCFSELLHIHWSNGVRQFEYVEQNY